MRIVGGSDRGRTIESVPGDATRPTADRVRQSLFDLLGQRCDGLRVLDLYAGTGALSWEALSGIAVSSADEAAASTLRALRVQQLVAAGPFLRSLRRAAPAELWRKLQAYSDEQGATLEQAASRHQRLLRDLTPAEQDKLEALAHFEAAELLRKVGAAHTGARLADRISSFVSREE